MADNMHFASREKLEVFIRQNPKRFLEELERSPDLRNNFQQLLQDWNNGDLIQIAQLLQGMEVRNPINNKLMIVEEKAKSFYHWSFNELREVQQNPYHKLTSFQHYLQETMKKREELEEEEEKARLKKNKEHKIQTKLDKEKFEQEKRNMDMIMSTTKSQFKQALRILVDGLNVSALQQLGKDMQSGFDSLKDNPEAKQFMLSWEKVSVNVLKGVKNADELKPVLKGIGLQIMAANQNEESRKEYIALLKSLGVPDAEEISERMRNGTATTQDKEKLQQTLVANMNDERVKKLIGDIPAVANGDPDATKYFQDNTYHAIQSLLEKNLYVYDKNGRVDMINNINNIVMNIKDNNNIETDVNENYHVKNEKMR